MNVFPYLRWALKKKKEKKKKKKKNTFLKIFTNQTKSKVSYIPLFPLIWEI